MPKLGESGAAARKKQESVIPGVERRKKDGDKKEGAHITKRKYERATIRQVVVTAAAILFVGGLASLLYVLFFAREPVQDLNLADPDKLKDVFFAGDPWVVHCYNNNEEPVPVVFHKASAALNKKGITVGMLNCSKPLPSGKTVMERFKLDSKVKTVAFLAANGKSPRQIPLPYLDNTDVLLAWVVEQSKSIFYEFRDTAHLKKKCYSRKLCVVAVNEGPLDTLKYAELRVVMQNNRNVTFGSIDTTNRAFSLQSKLPAGDGPQVVAFTKGDSGVGVKAFRGPFTSDDVNVFVNKMETGEVDVKWLKTPPTLIKSSAAKKEERLRKKNRNKDAKDGATPKWNAGATKKKFDAKVEKSPDDSSDDEQEGNSQDSEDVDVDIDDDRTGDNGDDNDENDENEVDEEVERQRQRRKEMEDEQRQWFGYHEPSETEENENDHEDPTEEEINADED